MKLSINGKIIDEKEAYISIFDRAYLFGEGLFETFRSYDGKIPFLEKHINRLEWASTFVGIPFPHPQSIKKGIFDVLQANKLKNGRIKVILSGVGEGFRPSIPTDNLSVNLVIVCEEFKSLPADDYKMGVELSVIYSVKNESPTVSNIKSTSWVGKMIAKREIYEKDAFDGILVNSQGYVTEATTANLFWVEKDNLCTAPTSIGLLGGITRQVVIECAKENGLKFKENLIDAEQLKKVSEVFITGSTLEVMPVVSIDNTPIGDGTPGKVTKEIEALYQERLAEELNSCKKHT